MGVYAGVVILYYPEDNIISNILSYSSYLEKMYVYDNSEKRNENLVKEIEKIPNTRYFNDGENRGIAKRLNQAAGNAISDNFLWLLTMDQDSSFHSESMKTYINCMNQCQYDTSAAMLGVEHEKPVPPGLGCSALKTDRLITSGSFVNLAIWSETGGFDEKLFIDEVDFEYCYKAGVAGYKVLKFGNIALDHQLGKISSHRSLKSFHVTSRTLHSPLRIYYMTRNHLYIKAKYDAYFKSDIEISRRGLVNRIKNNLFYGKRRWLLIKLLFKAVFDFKRGRMGKYDIRIK